MLKNFATVSFFTLISRLLGFARDIIFARILGVGMVAEAFFVAFKIPNFFRRLFAEGAFSSAFTPLYSKKRQDNPAEADIFASRILFILLVSLAIFTLICEIFMPIMAYIFAGGFAGDERYTLVVELSRITFPYLIFISLASLFAGILQARGRFAAYAAAPIILNLCLIAAAYWQPTPQALAWAVFIAGLLQLLLLIWAARRLGFRPRLGAKADTKLFRQRFFPAMMGAGVMHLNSLIDTVIASFITSAVTFLYYADRLIYLPLAVISTAISTVILPRLGAGFTTAIKANLLLIIPASIGLFILAEDIIRQLFEGGAFTASSTLATAYALKMSAIALPAFALGNIYRTMFFAMGDTKTPLRVAIYAVITNLALNICFVYLFRYLGWMPHLGIVLATIISSYLGLFMMISISNESIWRGQIKTIFTVLVASAAMLMPLLLIAVTGVWSLIVVISLAAATYMFAAFIAKRLC